MRRVEVPLNVQRQVKLLRRRLARKGQRTGRSLILSEDGRQLYQKAGTFMVLVTVKCSKCGRLWRVEDNHLDECRVKERWIWGRPSW